MKVFDAMGDRIEERRSGLNYDERASPGLAIDTIAETPELREFSANEIVDWVLESRRLPAQFDWRSRFGEPPITPIRVSDS